MRGCILDLKELKGLVATVVTTGTVRPLFAQSLSNMRDFNTRQDYLNSMLNFLQSWLNQVEMR